MRLLLLIILLCFQLNAASYKWTAATTINRIFGRVFQYVFIGYNKGPSGGGATLIQHRATTSTGTLAFNSATTTGHLLIVMMEANIGSAPVIASISNTGSATWARAVNSALSGGGQDVDIWYGTSNTGQSTDTVTVTLNSGISYSALYISEWSGPAGTSDGTGSAIGTSQNLATGSFGITSGDLVVGIGIHTNGVTTVGAGFTSLDTDTFSLAEYQVVSAGTINVTESTTNASSTWAIAGAAFK